MLLDKVFREFFGFSLILFATYLVLSLSNFNLGADFFPGMSGQIISLFFLEAFGYSSYYLSILLLLAGFSFILSTNNSKISLLMTINRFIIAFIAIFPLCVILSEAFLTDFLSLASAGIGFGGQAGDSLRQLTNGFLNEPWYTIAASIEFILLLFFSLYGIQLNFNKENISEATQAKPVVTKAPSLKKVNKPKTDPISKSPSPTQTPAKQTQVYLDFLDLLDQKVDDATDISKDYLNDLSTNLEQKLQEFNIEGQVEDSLPGPVITRFELNLAPGTKASQVSNIANDLARSLAVKSVRVVEVIEGKSTIGIEIPNPKRKVVTLFSTLSQKTTDQLKPLEFCIGKDIAGNISTVNLQELPHLLIAGTTGSGKSVGVNTILLNLLRNNKPEDLRLLLIDPKMLELSVYDDIPHLITPVITDMQKAANGLNWCVKEMDRRYKLMSLLGVRNLESYNQKILKPQSIDSDVKEQLEEISGPQLEKLPYIVVVIDELADLMMVTGKKVEQLIARLAQKARASGIHLVIATQRPSVDVITGLIKANIPSRMSFLVSSKVDSRTILDQGGAEQLLGKGDLLFIEPGTSIPKRIHCSFVADDEVQKIAKQLRESAKPNYIEEVTKSIEIQEIASDSNEDDDLYNQAVEFVVESRRASISSIQRKFRIGYNRAARLIETMEENGIVSPMNSNGSREVL